MINYYFYHNIIVCFIVIISNNISPFQISLVTQVINTLHDILTCSEIGGRMQPPCIQLLLSHVHGAGKHLEGPKIEGQPFQLNVDVSGDAAHTAGGRHGRRFNVGVGRPVRHEQGIPVSVCHLDDAFDQRQDEVELRNNFVVLLLRVVVVVVVLKSLRKKHVISVGIIHWWFIK